MSKINLIIVPAWLNLIKRELGITNDDLADCEKLSGILSPRDLLIYKMAALRAPEILAKFMAGGNVDAGKVVSDFCKPLPIPSLEDRAPLLKMDVNTLIYGATSARDKDLPLFAEVCFTDTEVMAICLVPFNRANDELKDNSDTLALKMVKALHGRLPLEQLAGFGVFKRYVEEIQINPVFY